MVGSHFGNVHEALDAIAHLNERTERHDLGDATVHQLANGVTLGKDLPRVHLRGLQRQADAFLRIVHVKNLDIDFVTDGDDFIRVLDVLPREFGDVDEAVHAAQIHEGTEVDHAGNHAATALSRLEVVEEIATLFLL